MDAIRSTLHHVASSSSDPDPFEPSTSESLRQIAFAGALFIAADAFFTYGQPQRWIQRLFRRAAHPSMQRADVDRAVPHASTRIVGALHILIQVPLAIAVLLSPSLQAHRLYSKNALSWRLVTTTAGYFVYDVYVHSIRFEYWPSLVHALGALAVFTTGIYCGVLHYYGAMFLLWECSTPFVFMRWGMHTLGQTQSRLYLVNGLTMMAVFFLCRNVLGIFMSIDFWRVSGAELANPHPGGVPAAALWLIRALNLVFNGLNALWFSKMLRGAIKVLKAKRSDRLEATAEAQVALSEKTKKHEE